MLGVLISGFVQAETLCDVRVGQTLGLRVVEFTTGNVIHSKMSIRDVSAWALKEEMLNLQDMGICKEKIVSQKCVLKIEKQNKVTGLSFIRGSEKWLTWKIEAKKKAENLIRDLKREGFCS